MSWNSSPSNQMDAAEGWDAYKGTNIGTDTPVIGTLDGVLVLISLGFKVVWTVENIWLLKVDQEKVCQQYSLMN